MQEIKALDPFQNSWKDTSYLLEDIIEPTTANTKKKVEMNSAR